MKILIIDDEEDMRFIISFSLMEAGFEVIKAASGLEAIKLLQTSVPDAILVDYLMPDMDGLSLMNQIKETVSPPVPFIYLTGKSDSDTLNKLKSSGAKGIIEKPFDPTIFANTVQALLKE
ncbi:MAG: response regulator [Fidelibacterota bacterium]